MMAYAPGMSFFDRLRGLFAGPAHMSDGGDPEAGADLQEEYGAPDAGEAELKAAEQHDFGGLGARGGVAPATGFGASEAAEVAEADLGSEEAPPDPNP
jgi:hypothetical protein